MAGCFVDRKWVLKSAPVGALIAKIGASSAGLTDGTLYLIGSFAIVEVPHEREGRAVFDLQRRPDRVSEQPRKDHSRDAVESDSGSRAPCRQHSEVTTNDRAIGVSARQMETYLR